MATPQSEILEKIKAQLDSGTVPWHKPWVVRENCILSRCTGKPYSLRNRMLLSFAGEYATFAQVKKLGGKVNKGAHGQVVYFSAEVKKKDENDEEKNIYVLRAYHVFNILDTDLTPKYKELWGGECAPQCDALTVVRNYCERTGVVLRECGSEAFYEVHRDMLQVPNIDTFSSVAEFWSTVFHEIAHSTGKRLGREYGHNVFGMADDAYCKEELVAEITAALCLGELGIDTEDSTINSAAYVAHWKKNLSIIKPNDFSAICKQAQDAVKFIFNKE